MDKPPRSKGANIFKYLRKAATFSVNNPRRPDHPAKAKAFRQSRAFSGPIIPFIPSEPHPKADPLDPQEPTSPKISCMGQIKHIRSGRRKDRRPSCVKRMFRRKVRPGRRADELESAAKATPAPMIGQMQRFATRREALAGFDWRKARKTGEEEGDIVLVAHSAPMLMTGGDVVLEPKKEVNIWKRRTCAAPIPLQLKS